MALHNRRMPLPASAMEEWDAMGRDLAVEDPKRFLELLELGLRIVGIHRSPAASPLPDGVGAPDATED